MAGETITQGLGAMETQINTFAAQIGVEDEERQYLLGFAKMQASGKTKEPSLEIARLQKIIGPWTRMLLEQIVKDRLSGGQFDASMREPDELREAVKYTRDDDIDAG